MRFFTAAFAAASWSAGIRVCSGRPYSARDGARVGGSSSHFRWPLMRFSWAVA